MITDIGFGILLLSFLLSLYAAFAAIRGETARDQRWVESARRALLIAFPLTTLSILALLYLLMTGRYDVAYVYSVTNNSMPAYLKLTALWGGQPGSLLFWSWLLSLFSAAVVFRRWRHDRDLLPWILVILSLTLAFFLSLATFFENPFIRFWQTASGQLSAMFSPGGATPLIPSDGQGLNPLLRHPGMIIHPPMLYLGYVAFVIPFAFAFAALIKGRTDDRWIRLTRRWTLWAWLFLSLGLVLGARWAYDVLGWGGYWGWDPVEIAAFMPWLTGTAFLHSIMIQEKRSMLRQWNMLLIILTYDLVLLGTFLSRSGVLSSVHAFAQSAIGPMFFVFIGITLIGSVALLIWRWPILRSDMEMKSMLSRESLFLLNNLLFIGILIVCLWGVIFPLISELVTGQKVTVGPPFYERATAPIFGALMALMAVAPLSAWGRSTFKTLGLTLWKPALAALAAPIAAWFIHITNFVALIGFYLVALVIAVTLYEFWRGARARQKSRGESFFPALWNLANRNRRRYGGYIIHIAMVLMAIGILGIEIFQTETQKSLAVGDAIQLDDYTVRFDSLAQFYHADGRWVTRAEVSIYQDGKFLQTLAPRYDVYPDGQPMTIPGLRSTLADDLYIVLVNWESVSASVAPFKIYHNPLVSWLWIGSLIFILGTVFTVLPEREKEASQGNL